MGPEEGLAPPSLGSWLSWKPQEKSRARIPFYYMVWPRKGSREPVLELVLPEQALFHNTAWHVFLKAYRHAMYFSCLLKPSSQNIQLKTYLQGLKGKV